MMNDELEQTKTDQAAIIENLKEELEASGW